MDNVHQSDRTQTMSGSTNSSLRLDLFEKSELTLRVNDVSVDVNNTVKRMLIPACIIQGSPLCRLHHNQFSNLAGVTQALGVWTTSRPTNSGGQTDTTVTNSDPPAECSKSQKPRLLGEKYALIHPSDSNNVYRCINVNTNQEYVCKVVTRDSHSLITAHYRLDGVPHMNPLHEVLVGDRYYYLVFPRSHGDLHSYVRQRRRLRETEARRLFRQMAETVLTCHEQGVVLRDLKLRKFVFADPQRTELKLETLEDAVVLEDPEHDLLHDKRGCPAYVSPEILRAGANYSGKAADMWSLGVILYTMLVGRYPFNDSEHTSLFAKIARGNYSVPECLSSRAKCLIRSLLRREPSERIASEDVLLHPWLAREDNSSSGHPYLRKPVDQLVPDTYFSDED